MKQRWDFQKGAGSLKPFVVMSMNTLGTTHLSISETHVNTSGGGIPVANFPRYTRQDGTTLRLPLPKHPYLSNINCLYAAFLNCRVLLSTGSFLISALFRIQSCNMSGSKQSL